MTPFIEISSWKLLHSRVLSRTKTGLKSTIYGLDEIWCNYLLQKTGRVCIVTNDVIFHEDRRSIEQSKVAVKRKYDRGAINFYKHLFNYSILVKPKCMDSSNRCEIIAGKKCTKSNCLVHY